MVGKSSMTHSRENREKVDTGLLKDKDDVRVVVQCHRENDEGHQ